MHPLVLTSNQLQEIPHRWTFKSWSSRKMLRFFLFLDPLLPVLVTYQKVLNFVDLMLLHVFFMVYFSNTTQVDICCYFTLTMCAKSAGGRSAFDMLPASSARAVPPNHTGYPDRARWRDVSWIVLARLGLAWASQSAAREPACAHGNSPAMAELAPQDGRRNAWDRTLLPRKTSNVESRRTALWWEFLPVWQSQKKFAC